MDLYPVSRKPRGFWGKVGYVLGGPVAAFGVRHVMEGAHVIRLLMDVVKQGPGRDGRLRIEADRTVDLRATSFLFGTTEADIAQRLANRRRQSARATFCYLIGGFGFFGLWFFEAILSARYVSTSYIVGLFAVCVVFFLSAFHNAMINWQARTRRLGTVRDFLNARVRLLAMLRISPRLTGCCT